MIVPLGVYLVLVFLLSLYAFRKRTHGNFLQEYFLGNRSISGFVLAMTMTSTYVSASSFIGGPGAAYKYGLGWVLLSLIQLPAVWLSLGVLGKKFAILAIRYNAVTLNDMLLYRFGSKLLVWFSSVNLLIAFIGAMTVQFVGAARLLETAASISYESGLIFFGISITFYTAFGGFRASVLNDVFQGLVMLLGTIILLVTIVYLAGGVEPAIEKLRHIDPALISPTGVDGLLTPKFMTSYWLLICFGVIGLPHTAVRCISYRDSKAVHRAIILGTVVIGVLMFGMPLAGALGRAVLPGLNEPDLVVPTLIVRLLPTPLSGIFLAAPLAAIMSTINAQLSQSSATIIKDIYLSLQPKQAGNERRLKRMSSLVTLVLGLLILMTAWHPPEMIIWINLLAFGGMQAVFLWPLVLGLYWERAHAAGAISSMIIGGISYATFAWLHLEPGGFHPIVLALTLSLVAFLAGNCFKSPISTAV